jgi:hypothetical protein
MNHLSNLIVSLSRNTVALSGSSSDRRKARRALTRFHAPLGLTVMTYKRKGRKVASGVKISDNN